jgi:hypothetical protein
LRKASWPLTENNFCNVFVVVFLQSQQLFGQRKMISQSGEKNLSRLRNDSALHFEKKKEEQQKTL